MTWYVVRWESKRALYDHASLDEIEETAESELAGFEGSEIVATVDGEHPTGSHEERLNLARVLVAAGEVVA